MLQSIAIEIINLLRKIIKRNLAFAIIGEVEPMNTTYAELES